jgi:hypothetical protein
MSLRFILLLSTHLSVCLPSDLFPAIFPTKILYTSFSHVSYMPRQSRPPRLDHSNYTWWRVQVTQLLIMQFPPAFCHFISVRSTYSPQQPPLKRSQSTFLPLYQRPSFTPIQNQRQNYSSAYSNFYVFREQTRRQQSVG